MGPTSGICLWKAVGFYISQLPNLLLGLSKNLDRLSKQEEGIDFEISNPQREDKGWQMRFESGEYCYCYCCSCWCLFVVCLFCWHAIGLVTVTALFNVKINVNIIYISRSRPEQPN